jgi:predicted transcriptional regulator
MEGLHKQVSKAIIDNINKIFLNDNPAKLSKTLEVFIALLRNKQNTKPVDVELFFQDHAKLVSKMAKHETTYCNLETI